MYNAFLLFHSPEPWGQVLILIYRNWSIAYAERRINVFSRRRTAFSSFYQK